MVGSAIEHEALHIERCLIRIIQGKGNKDRQVPFPRPFRELLALHMEQMKVRGAVICSSRCASVGTQIEGCAKC
ncbi:hypothetical protein [Ktedonobacter robiniae]|uniref:Uncharacterized protein n=1 Tax=Ktedonobacter robiniae TaxID=2778365 RepID=A0ABQ3UTH6_9CHLR|nr:hypothetical protein [Ktedonobacter robiniae]GHO56134.1 hypothetical protein KSB_46090 [Ktedonobacter robiniae]